MQNANYSYPLPHVSPTARTTPRHTSSRVHLPFVPGYTIAQSGDGNGGAHVRRESRFDDAFEEPDLAEEENAEEKVETMRDFLTSSTIPRPQHRTPFGKVTGNIPAVGMRSIETTAKSSRRTLNRLKRSPGKEPRGLIPSRIPINSIRKEGKSPTSGIETTFNRTRRPLEDRCPRSSENQRSGQTLPEPTTISKKKSILDFASNLTHKPRLGVSDGMTKNRTVFAKFGKRKPLPNDVIIEPFPSSVTTTTQPAPSPAEIRESIDSEYSFIDPLAVSPSDRHLPLFEESLWGEQDGGVPRRVGKKKSFAGVGIMGIMKGLHTGRKESARELRHEESTATLRPSKHAPQSLRSEHQTASSTAHDDASPSSPTSSIESFQSRFPDPRDTSRDWKPQDERRTGSPALPTFHFTRASYSGSNFRVELGGEEVPPVPAVPAVFSRPIGAGVGGLRETAKASAGTASNPRGEATDRSQETINTSYESSFVHVEHALDDSEEYSLISGTSAVREERRQSGKLPWRRSVQGAFGDEGKTAEGLPCALEREKRPSVMDLKKVSTVTGTLQAFLDTYATSPSIVSNFSTSPTKVTQTPHLSVPANLSAKLDSPSPSQISDLGNDSPTPMRKYAHHPYSRSLRAPTKQESSPPRVSPLRLALGHSLAKSQKGNVGADRGATGGSKIFDENPFLESKKSSPRNAFAARRAKDSPTFGRSRVLDEYLKDASSNASPAHTGNQPSTVFPAVGDPARLRGCSTATQDTVSSADPDDQIRGSFDFTGEYRALNENGTRQSFVDELERFGLDAGGESFRIENFLPECERSVGVGAENEVPDLSGDLSRSTASRQPVKRNAYGFIENFKFGTSPSGQSAAIPTTFDANLTSSSSSPPKEPLPIPTGSLYSGNSRFRENGGNVSRFSMSTMSSLGRVVDTRIAGADFVNVFEREFGGLLQERDRSISSDNFGSHVSLNVSGEQQRERLRRPSHARIASFASDASQKEHRFESFSQIHRRQKSSPDIKSGTARRHGAANVSDEKDSRTGSVAVGQAAGRLIKYSKDSLLDSSYHLSTKDSILNSLPEITEDSVFQSGSRQAREDSFIIKPILGTLGSDPSECKIAVSPLAARTRPNVRNKLIGITKSAELPENTNSADEDAANIEQYLLRAAVEESVDDVSFRSLTKAAADGAYIARKPSRNSRSRPSSFLLASGTLPALSSSGRSVNSSRLSADVHSMISMMLDSEPESKIRWSRQLKGLSQLSQIAPPIQEERAEAALEGLSLANAASSVKQNVSIGPTAPLALTRWTELQRLADEELLKSRSTWQDTMKSIEALTDFKPPTTATGLRAMLRNSVELHQPLSEISPGTQVMRRENFLAEEADKARAPPSESPTSSGKRLSALPTKYMMADTGISSSPGRFQGSDDKAEQRSSVWDVFAKFALPANTEPALAPVATRSLIPKRINVAPQAKTEQSSKQRTEGRPRAPSSIRRQKTGWTRRKEVAASSPLGGRRITKRSSRVAVQDPDKENAIQASQKKRASGYRSSTKPSHKAMRI